MDPDRRADLIARRDALKATQAADDRRRRIVHHTERLEAAGVACEVLDSSAPFDLWRREHFPSLPSSLGLIDWARLPDARVLPAPTDDEAAAWLRALVPRFGPPETPAVVFWSNAALPAIQLALGDLPESAFLLTDEFEAWAMPMPEGDVASGPHAGVIEAVAGAPWHALLPSQPAV